MKKVGILGFGRFGETLARLLNQSFDIYVYDNDKSFKNRLKNFSTENRIENISICADLKELYSCEVIFLAIPISKFEQILKDHKEAGFITNQLLIDLLSVKTHPEKVLKKILKGTKARAILTHPMFGPDSSKNGFNDLTIVTHNLSGSKDEYTFWLKFFKLKGLNIVEMEPDEHDKSVAYSQGITHFIGRVVGDLGIQPTSIDTMGAKRLQTIVEHTCNDTWELFQDLQTYNPYTEKMRKQLKKSCEKISKAIGKV